MYICLPNLCPSGLSEAYHYRGIVRYGMKDLEGALADYNKAISLGLKSFAWLVKYDFKSRFNIIKYKYVKEFHFGIIFLAKKFVFSTIICIFAALVPAEPLYNA